VIANILIAAGVVWVLLSILSFMQFVQLRSIYNVLSEKGRILAGQDQGLFRTKYRLFAAVSKEGVVSDARVLKVVRFVTPPVVLECPQLIGFDLNNPDAGTPDADPRIQQAAKNLKLAWAKLKPTLNPGIPSIAPKRDADTGTSLDTAALGTAEAGGSLGNEYLGRAEKEIRSLLADNELRINREPLKTILAALAACNQTHSFGTDEVIADKAYQLRMAFRSGNAIDIPKADGLIETILRLITQREREAGFRS
jgi:DNA-binding transcriptional regulator of glucitol operon